MDNDPEMVATPFTEQLSVEFLVLQELYPESNEAEQKEQYLSVCYMSPS